MNSTGPRSSYPSHRRNDWSFPAEDHIDLRRPGQHGTPVTVEAAQTRLTLDLERTALIVVDMQNDFCHPDGWLAGIGVDIAPARAPIPVLVDLVPRMREAGVPVIWVNWGNRPDQAGLPPGVRHVYDPDGTGLGIGSTSNAAGTPVLQHGSWSAALVDELTVDPADIALDKYRMSGFVDTALDSTLRHLRVDTLLFAGVNTDQCVLSTLMDAANLGYDVIAIENACGTTSPDFCREATIYTIRQCFGFTVPSWPAPV